LILSSRVTDGGIQTYLLEGHFFIATFWT